MRFFFRKYKNQYLLLQNLDNNLHKSSYVTKRLRLQFGSIHSIILELFGIRNQLKIGLNCGLLKI